MDTSDGGDRMNTFEELRDKASGMELAAVNFLTAKGELARKRRFVETAEFVFVDGVKLVLPKVELDRQEFDEMRFRLRPTKDHA